MGKALVLFDDYNWMQDDGSGKLYHCTAHRGDVIDVSDDEVKRGVDLGGLTEDLDTTLPDRDAVGLGESEGQASQGAPATPEDVAQEDKGGDPSRGEEEQGSRTRRRG